MTNIDWTEFDGLPEMNCTCRCGADFRSHFKVTYEADVRQTTTRKSCPKCGRNDDTYAARSDSQEFTIRP